MQSHILAGVSSSPLALAVWSGLKGAGGNEREQPTETTTAESGRNGSKSRSRPHLMKHHKYNRQLPFRSFFLLYLSLSLFLCQHTPTHTLFNKILYSIAAFTASASVEMILFHGNMQTVVFKLKHTDKH